MWQLSLGSGGLPQKQEPQASALMVSSAIATLHDEATTIAKSAPERAVRQDEVISRNRFTIFSSTSNTTRCECEAGVGSIGCVRPAQASDDMTHDSEGDLALFGIIGE